MDDAFIPVARPEIGTAEIHAALRVLRSGQLAQGREVAALETEFSAHVHGRQCVAVSSGTSALWLILHALGITAGDEVIVPSFSFPATAAAVALTGAAPVFADIDPATYCLDPHAVAAAITPRTAAVIPVHLYGQCAALDQFRALAQHHGLALVEDAAQAHGAALDGHPAGTFGTAAAFSFYTTKNIHAVEGGMTVTADAQLAEKIRMLRNQGMNAQGLHELVGVNARMTDLSAAIGRAQLRKLAPVTDARRHNAALLDAALGAVTTIPWSAPGARHVYHQYTIRVDAGLRAGIITSLRSRGIGAAVHYRVPIHRQPAFSPADSARPHLPHTDTAADQVLCLPVHPSLTDTDLHRVADAVRDAISAGSPL
ncbi:DegT/DnrJ/EryC1/StrS family aminotransferase [Saccharopolyspora hattusasensis]|uniref:DegT/DnrJ/EryC1/StrS family aminotransferase n=1 Tax=Saccharopolyspora hattusasensis TaxID=1128679 RepID=UPI003D95F368